MGDAANTAVRLFGVAKTPARRVACGRRRAIVRLDVHAWRLRMPKESGGPAIG